MTYQFRGSRFFPQLPCVLPFYECAPDKMMTGIERQQHKGKFLSLRKADSAIGAALCAIAALAASSIASGHSWESTVPLAFSVFLLAIAVVFGMRAGVIGSVLAAVVFAA